MGAPSSSRDTSPVFFINDGLGVTEATRFALLDGSKLVEHRVLKFDEGSLKLLWLRRKISHNGLQPGAYELVGVGRVRGVVDGRGMIDGSSVRSRTTRCRAVVGVDTRPPPFV